jgi:hypothetical protein
VTTGRDAPPTGMLRPLPRLVAPVGGELSSSFLRRVALANRLDPEEFRAYVAADDRKRAAVPMERLAILSGQPEARLRRALDDSSDPAAPDGLVRAACTLCMARRGIAMPVTVRLAATAVVCREHQRWLNDRHSGGQPHLHRHPEVLAANRSHRRLVRRLGPTRSRPDARQGAGPAGGVHGLSEDVGSQRAFATPRRGTQLTRQPCPAHCPNQPSDAHPASHEPDEPHQPQPPTRRSEAKPL